MFISKIRPVVFPQTEHLKLAAVIARHWGNDEFAKPPVPNESFVRGVEFHDSGYGHFDIHAVGQQTEDNLLRLWRRCTAQSLGDPIAEIIVKRHFQRLSAAHTHFPGLAIYSHQLAEEADHMCHTRELDPKIFDMTDTIVNLCDEISFAFCHEDFATYQLDVYKQQPDLKQKITFTLMSNHSIILDPYPLDEALISGNILAYDKNDYPNVLLEEQVEYQIMRKP